MSGPRRRTPARPRGAGGARASLRPRTAASLAAAGVLTLAACSRSEPVPEPRPEPNPLRVAVVESFAAPAGEIARAFEEATGAAVAIDKGPAERLDREIRAGSGHAVLLAADEERPRRLEADGLAVPGMRVTYAVGQLALWSPDPARLAGEAVLRSGDFASLAMPDPTSSPYGVAARQVLDARAPTAGRADKLRLVADPGEALEAAASGAAQLAFVAGSQLATGELAAEGSWWIVPSELHDPIRHQAVLLAAGADDPRARELLGFLAGPAAQEIVARYGYGTEQALE